MSQPEGPCILILEPAVAARGNRILAATAGSFSLRLIDLSGKRSRIKRLRPARVFAVRRGGYVSGISSCALCGGLRQA
jgi:hypothetical protein